MFCHLSLSAVQFTVVLVVPVEMVQVVLLVPQHAMHVDVSDHRHGPLHVLVVRIVRSFLHMQNVWSHCLLS